MRVLYHDDWFVAVDKPAGLQVHRNFHSNSRIYALQTLRERLNRRVFPIHRLDRAASGVLLFGLTSTAAREACRLFHDRAVAKTYLAVARGFVAAEGMIDHPLDGRPAETGFRRRATLEWPVATGRYATSRYSLVEVFPRTGRRHQLRRHFHHVFHPLIGDTTYGEGRHNRLFRERLGVSRLLLTARRLEMTHPFTGAPMAIEAGFDVEWRRVLAEFGVGETSRETAATADRQGSD